MANVKAAFIHAFAMQGPKWGLASQLHSAERKNGESMRDFIYRLKHLNSRCQPDKRFRDDQLLDRFINGMNHKELYNSMITQGITTWDDTITAVIQLEDNLEMKDSVNTPSTASATKSTKDDASPPIEQVVARYLQRMGTLIGTSHEESLPENWCTVQFAMESIPRASAPHSALCTDPKDTKTIGKVMKAKL